MLETGQLWLCLCFNQVNGAEMTHIDAPKFPAECADAVWEDLDFCRRVISLLPLQGGFCAQTIP